MSGNLSGAREPHSGRADSISHLARNQKEGPGSWGAGAWDRTFAHSTQPGAELQGWEKVTNSLFLRGLAKCQVLCLSIISLDPHSKLMCCLHFKDEKIRGTEKSGPLFKAKQLIKKRASIQTQHWMEHG